MTVALCVMSDYSLLKSLIQLPEFIPFLKEHHYPACGLCDENLFGVIEFYDLCLANEIKPIIGLKVPFLNTYIRIYAKNYQGYLHILKIHTAIQEKKDVSKLESSFFEEVLVVLDVQELELYDELLSFFSKEQLYVGYQNSVGKNNAYLKTNQVVFLPEIKAMNLKEAESLDILKAIDQNGELANIEQTNYLYQTMECIYGATKEDEASTIAFASLCNVTIPKTNRYIPHFDETIADSFQYLVALTKKGLQKRFQNHVPLEYVNRLKYELSVIRKMGFVDYFLIVYDYVKYAKKNHILVGLGRGSAVGSLVTYTLGITDVNPMAHHLLFERFLNPERITMPDIDIDFEETGRADVVTYVKKRYGEKRVANILTFGTLKSKLAVRSVGKALGLSVLETDDFVSLLDANLSLKENMKNSQIKDAVLKNPKLKEVLRQSLRIEGLKKHASVHASGVIISSVDLDEVIPITYSNKDLLTGLTMNYLEELGLLKMDFLSLSNLAMIANVLKLIYENTGKRIDLNHIDFNDPKVMKMFHEADTIGIFQFESEGMKSFLKKLKPESLEDLISAIALYRPGPMENIDTYIRRKEKKEAVTYLHPSLEPILKETYGIIVYQEQIMQILVLVAKYSYAEADLIRRAMSKKKKEVMEAGRTDFIKRACQNNYSKQVSEEIYDLILKFANYGFNKSHSVSYAMIGVQMAYLKCYYPLYFLTNVLNLSINSIEKTKEYMTLAKKYGIKFLLPSINKSKEVYLIEGQALRIPLSLIKNLGVEAVRSIVVNRGEKPYVDYLDFFNRNYGKSVNQKTIDSLIMAGAFDEFGENHNTLRSGFKTALGYAKLLNGKEDNSVLKPGLEKKPDLTEAEKRDEEYASFGFFISNHPASSFQEPHLLKLNHIQSAFDKYVTCVVLVEKIKKIKTKKNEDMAFVVASDETEVGNFVIFHSELKRLPTIQVGDLVLVQGRVTKRFSDYQININQLQKVSIGGM